MVHPFRNSEEAWLKGLGLGVSGTIGDHENPTRSYVSAGARRFFGFRSGVGTDPNVAGAGQVWRISPQGYCYWGPFGLFGEYVMSSQTLLQAGGGPTAGQRSEIQNTGWQIAASYFLTGERNSFRPVAPRNPVTLASEGGYGAWEITARVGKLSIDDAAFPVFADPLLSARSAFSWGVGLNWHLRARLKIRKGPATRDFVRGRGGETGASPQRAVTVEPTKASRKRPVARRVFAGKAAWLRCSSVTDP